MINRKHVWARNLRSARLGLNQEGRKRADHETPMSQGTLARRLAVSQQTVSMWERGLATPRDDIRPRIAEALHRPVDSLFPFTKQGAAA